MYHGDRLQAVSTLFIFIQAVDSIVEHANEFIYLRDLRALRIEDRHDFTGAECSLYRQLCDVSDACFLQECSQRVSADHGSV